ncbi:cyanophycinase [Brevibacillus choshinensis]|uniref:Cyanophycinase n=1 Tax=Brevibacillus choshinensis TaxID=54911 RepID=A0ABX7FQL4_BRECH|nr:cyanophycinase [Brevibacillus choshinensis]QRG67611.1 cyanophycinase [Brevibacillus choshinensis]
MMSFVWNKGFSKVAAMLLSALLAVTLGMSEANAQADTETTKGSLVIIGGANESDNAELYNRMIELAGGKKKAVIGIFPTASASMSSSKGMKKDFEDYGVPADQVRIIEITEGNYAEKVNNDDVVSQISECTAFFFVGGDQARITKAFYNPDGSNTKALDAVWEVYQNGGMVAGTSAGAAIMSKTMIQNATSLETLQLGVTYEEQNPGLWVTKGLGFFDGGIVDQHFSKRGRIGRLVVALVQEKVDYGFGIDENSAMVVTGPEIEVIGESGMFLIDASKATLSKKGVYQNLDVSYLEKGDVYNYVTKKFTIESSKTLIPKGKEYYEGNQLNTNIFGLDAAKLALLDDLADNTADQARGLAFTMGQKKDKGTGVSVVFSKTKATKGYYDADEYASSILHVDMEITPIEVQVKETNGGKK